MVLEVGAAECWCAAGTVPQPAWHGHSTEGLGWPLHGTAEWALTAAALHCMPRCCSFPDPLSPKAALAKGLVNAAEVERAAAAAGAGLPLDVSQLLPTGGAVPQQLLAVPVHVVAFSDEEGVRWAGRQQPGAGLSCSLRGLHRMH